ncbi:MAG: hypothetical protein A2900_05070 [Candidatus Chisholmbacteria bacterium RIFCSPLOWO2_01_FULL_50_28]|uniref:Penicillin-binding protein 2 n=1 Tax=Candidatus Chisholmbacteria bacterium RIFCSPHIGHO2_01_FULL_52_32 TaxID=1797591 RepID=A0A1G1VSM1_9BACT|nr:MAG: hypothetical protein A2786_01670 [Candidatus Chisholmbacteria bacterium RIFCSPHIGHO2_01_FULL_52_32]OGY20419.1 MAG: hypothetical protein A2900_05070 [Candidatus Chisholmbacteria bacterium RIFCSPLOWO2_01_FULL_50_28]
MKTSVSLGPLFADELQGRTLKEATEVSPVRLRWLGTALVIIFGAFFLRLVWLQVVKGQENRILSEENRILARRIPAPRGLIQDRNGEILVQNIPVYRKRNPACPRLNGEAASEDCTEFLGISREEALQLEVSGRGSEVVTLVGRTYPLGASVSHLTGYVGEVTREELSLHSEYSLGDLIGKTGVERTYDGLLHGRDGAELVEVDVRNQVVREVSQKKPVSGTDLELTIDRRLQLKAFEAISDRKGALVALDPRNGEVLALISSPSFDPNNVAISLDRQDEPFFFRAIGGAYPPGSVFKVVTASAGLEEGKIDAQSEFEDTGEIRVGLFRYGNWYFDQYGRKEGFLNIVQAIKRSNDIFFYKVGQLVGPTRLSEWAKVYGFGRLSGIDLPGEAEGLVPSPLWKERERGERWFLGNTYHFAIGQADLETTPLQVSQMTAVVASGGRLCRPHVLFREGSEETSDDGLCQELNIADETIRLVSEGMVEACRPGGTGFPFFNFGVTKDGEFRQIEVGCKTGTAEYGDSEGRTHAWFTVFAPAEAPRIVVTVLLEGAGEGSYQAAPVAKEFLSYYFSEVSE